VQNVGSIFFSACVNNCAEYETIAQHTDNSSMGEVMDYDQQKSIIAKITWLYYINDYTQQQIADSMHISRTKVTRYLKKAKEMGLVKISVSTAYHSCFDKEQKLKEMLSLKDVIIAPSAGTAEETIKGVGIAGASYLNNILASDDILGIAWGRSLYNVALNLEAVKQKGDKKIEVIQLMGGLSQSGKINPEEIVKEIARKLNAKGTWLNTPAIVSTKQTRDILMLDMNIKTVFEKAKTCTKCILGLGDVDEEASLRVTGSLSHNELEELIDAGAVGDILSRFFDKQGNSVQTSVSDRIISVPLEDIKEIPERIAFTTGVHKVKTIAGASRGGYINVLVTDENTADSVIEYMQDN